MKLALRERTLLLLTLAGCLALLLPYAPTLQGFFANDDWVLLHHYGRIPLSRPWEFFGTNVVWFYRPLQSLQFGLLYQLFGLNAAPYNAALFGMHLGVCLLTYRLVREISGRPALAAGATVLFAGQWIYVDILLWKANFNSVQWAIVTLAACAAFARYLREGNRRWLAAAYGLSLLNFLTKEMAVNTAFLLLLVWATVELRREQLAPAGWAAAFRRAACLVGPVVAATALYVVAHHLLIRDIYVEQKPGYSFVGPLSGARQALFIYNHTLLSFYADPFLVGRAPWLQGSLQAVVQYFLPLPVLVGLFAWLRRDRVLLFGLGWILLSFVPSVFLKDFHASRFYYLPAIGSAVVLARLGEMAWQWLGSLPVTPARVGRAAVAAGFAYLLLVGVGVTGIIAGSEARESEQVRFLFALLQRQRGLVAPHSLVVLRNAPHNFFQNGLGAREMAKFALDNPQVEAVIDGQDMTPARVAALKQIPNVYMVDMGLQPMRLVQVQPPGGSRRAAR